jgi:hypothetical protein
MNVAKLFQVLVVTGASTTAGLAACGGSGGGSPGGSSNSGEGLSCGSVCKPNTATAAWTDCNGCCCWLQVGQTCAVGTPICADDPCCVGRGR